MACMFNHTATSLLLLKVRNEVVDMKGMRIEELPYCVKMGMPPAMRCLEACTFWGERMEALGQDERKATGCYDPGPKEPGARQLWREAQEKGGHVRIYMEQTNYHMVVHR